jgi:hypothetical protein
VKTIQYGNDLVPLGLGCDKNSARLVMFPVCVKFVLETNINKNEKQEIQRCYFFIEYRA